MFAIILIPVAIGMLICHYNPSLAGRLEKFVRVFAAVFLVFIILGAVISERENLSRYFYQVGAATALFCLPSLLVGYFVPKLAGVTAKLARACAFEIGVHLSTLAMTIALTLMNNTEMAIPAAIYSLGCCSTSSSRCPSRRPPDTVSN